MNELLKGQCKQDFNNWYDAKFSTNNRIEGIKMKNIVGLNYVKGFYLTPHSMQWGVIVDFFRERLKFNEFLVFYSIYSKAILNVSYTPTKARAAAIEKATEIYNEKFK